MQAECRLNAGWNGPLIAQEDFSSISKVPVLLRGLFWEALNFSDFGQGGCWDAACGLGRSGWEPSHLVNSM